jgi:MFS family permease
MERKQFSNLGDGLMNHAAFTGSSADKISFSNRLLGHAEPARLIFALQAGHRRSLGPMRIMLWVNGGRLVILGVLTLAVIKGYASLPMLYIAALLLGIGETLMDTALTSIVPSVVSKDRLTWANARLTAAQTVTNTFIGPPLAGYLAGWASPLPPVPAR